MMQYIFNHVYYPDNKRSIQVIYYIDGDLAGDVVFDFTDNTPDIVQTYLDDVIRNATENSIHMRYDFSALPISGMFKVVDDGLKDMGITEDMFID